MRRDMLIAKFGDQRLDTGCTIEMCNFHVRHSFGLFGCDWQRLVCNHAGLVNGLFHQMLSLLYTDSPPMNWRCHNSRLNSNHRR